MKQKSIFLSLLFLSFFLLTSCASSGKISYTVPSSGISQKELTKQLGSRPGTIENQDDAQMYIYNNCKYYGYTSEMTYFFAQDMFTLCRWESIAKSEEAGRNMYQNISKNISAGYGDGTLSEDGNSGTWDNGKKMITLGYIHDEDGYKVYSLENNY